MSILIGLLVDHVLLKKTHKQTFWGLQNWAQNTEPLLGLGRANIMSYTASDQLCLKDISRYSKSTLSDTYAKCL